MKGITAIGMRHGSTPLLPRLALFAGLGFIGLPPTFGATITFDNDALGFKPVPFQSVDSALVTFSILFDRPNFKASNLFIENEPTTHGNSNVLELSGSIPDKLVIDFSVPITALSFEFGGDSNDPFRPNPDADLTLFNGATMVGHASLLSNGDGIVNQSLQFSGPAFNRAVFSLAAGAETIDNVVFSLVPEPSNRVLPVIGLIAFAGIACYSRRRAFIRRA